MAIISSTFNNSDDINQAVANLFPVSEFFDRIGFPSDLLGELITSIANPTKYDYDFVLDSKFPLSATELHLVDSVNTQAILKGTGLTSKNFTLTSIEFYQPENPSLSLPDERVVLSGNVQFNVSTKVLTGAITQIQVTDNTQSAHPKVLTATGYFPPNPYGYLSSVFKVTSFDATDGVNHLTITGSFNLHFPYTDKVYPLEGKISAYSITTDTSQLTVTSVNLPFNSLFKVDETTGQSAGDIPVSSFIASVELASGSSTLAQTIVGGDASETLSGGQGNDVLNGKGGVDHMDGKNGSDIYVIDKSSDHTGAEVTDTGTGVKDVDEVRFASTIANDTLVIYDGESGFERIVIGTGTASAAVTTGMVALNVDATQVGNKITIIGNAGNNSITGGHAGSIVDAGAGNDTVVAINGESTLQGGAGNDSLRGATQGDSLVGGDGNDTLDGFFGGPDTLSGGAGNDEYHLNNTTSTIVEASGGGTDTVISMFDYTLAANLENLTLVSGPASYAKGNALNNVLTANNNGNTLDGGAGADTMIGGQGLDTFYVDSINDRVLDAGAAPDTVIASVNYSLVTAGGPNTTDNLVENLTLTGSANLTATGNALNNALTGNAGNNLLEGNAGDDTLEGGLGNDTLIGGLGKDQLKGGAGADLYIINSPLEQTDGINTLDRATEILDLGTSLTEIDELRFTGAGLSNTTSTQDERSLGFVDYAYGIEKIVLVTGIGAVADTTGTLNLNVDASKVVPTNGSGSGTLTIIGNNGNNTLIGTNTATNSIAGGGGNDSLVGQHYNDTFNGGTGNDTLSGGAGSDTAIFNGAMSDYSFGFNNGVLSIKDNVLANGNDGTDSLTGIEKLQFTNGSLQVTGEFQINALTLGNQLDSQVISLGQQGFFVAWDTIYTDNISELSGQFYGVNGLATGVAFTINKTAEITRNIQPNIVQLANGNIVSIWETNQPGSGKYFVNVIQPDGIALYEGLPLDVGNVTSVTSHTLVSMADGGFLDVVTGKSPADTNGGVFALRYDEQGSPIGSPVLVNAFTSEVPTDIAATGLTSGGKYVVTWTMPNEDGSGYGVYGQAFKATGGKLGTEFLVNTDTAGNQTNLALASKADGGFVAAFSGTSGVTLQFFNANLAKVGGELVLPLLTGDETIHDFSLVQLSNGHFVATYTMDASANKDGDGQAVYACMFDGAGNLTTPAFLVNTITAGNQHHPHISVSADGGFTIVWTSTATDGSTSDIYAKQYDATGQEIMHGLYGTALADAITFDANQTFSVNGLAGNDTITGANLNDVLQGGDGNDKLTGLAGNDTLDGGTGIDTLAGADGDDTYIVDNVKDVIVEANTTGSGNDTVYSAVSYTLTSNLEKLVLQPGIAAINGTGNIGNNTLIGNDGNNQLDGGAGDDSLVGGAGDDTLIGGAGADTMAGGDGSDTYVIDNISDTIVNELGGNSAPDTISTTLANFALQDNVGAGPFLVIENLVYTGTGNFSGTGNVSDNSLSGAKGNDTLVGLVGNDTLFGNAGNDSLNGGEGNDVLNGGLGNDTMAGGAGNDVYDYTLGDKVIENAGEGVDILAISGAGINLDFSKLTSSTISNIDVIDITGTGNNSLTLNSASIAAISEAKSLVIDGNVGDTLVLQGGAWQIKGLAAQNGQHYYNITNGVSSLQIDTDIQIKGTALVNEISATALAGSYGKSFTQVADYFGVSIAGIGDFNRDGYADIAVTSPTITLASTGTGPQVYVVYGSSNGLSANDLNTLNGTDGFILTGESAFGNIFHLGNAGDMNGDGVSDFIMSGSSLAFIAYGQTGGVPANYAFTDLVGQHGITMYDPNIFTIDVSMQPGTLNDDAYSDSLLYATGNISKYRVFYGTDAPFNSTIDYQLNTDGLMQANQVKSATILHDINQDGIDELVFSESKGNEITFKLSDGNRYSISFVNAGLPAIPGYKVADLGDLNGDGYHELGVGNPSSIAFGDALGGMYILSGKSLSTQRTDTDFNVLMNSSDACYLSTSEIGQAFGSEFSAAGDVNGDGYADFIVGSGYNDNHGTDAGESYLIFGGPNMLTGKVDVSSLLDGAHGLRLTGVMENGHFGDRVSAGGDINGDGYDDVLITSKGNGFSVLYGQDFSHKVNVSGTNANDKLTGTANGDVMVSGQGNDSVLGLAGADTITTGVGDDTLDGGLGNDLLKGGYGNDLYIVDSLKDQILEEIAGGTDTIRTNLATYSLKMLISIENLTYAGSSAFKGTGNSLNNTLTAGTANDTLSGGLGQDALVGGAGNDSLAGEEGNDTLAGGVGNDTMLGGAGNDVYDYTLGDKVIENAGEGVDTITISGKGLNLDFSKLTSSTVSNMDVIDITGSGNNTLTLSNTALKAIAENNTLKIMGNAGDTLKLTPADAAGWNLSGTVNENGQDFFQYTKDGITLKVDADISNNLINSHISIATLNGHSGFKLAGEAALDFLGHAVSNAGDVNGDGYDDVVVGAFSADPNGDGSGASYVVFGKASGLASNIDLSSLDGSNGFKLAGVSAYDSSGASVSNAGDINGDGFSDVIISAYNAGPNGVRSGASYVVFGKANGFASTMELASLDGSNGFKLSGVSAKDLSGRSVSNAGDVNGDGYDDLIIGASGTNSNGSLSGASYVVFGKSSGFDSNIDLASLDGSNGFKLSGVGAGDSAGQSVSSAGDVNGDGYGDLLVGAPYASKNPLYSGAAYVVFGKANGFDSTIQLADLNGTSGFKLSGIHAYDYAGFSVSNAGDVNGDGYDDLIVGARYAEGNIDKSAVSYVVFGKASGFTGNIQLSALNGTNGFKLTGENANNFAGCAVSNAGDVNGDGYDDLIIGASSLSPSDGLKGESYVLFGKANGFSSNIQLTTLNGLDGFKLSGAATGDFFGESVSSAGDVNGDGYDDLIIGATGADPNGDRSGTANILYGSAFNGKTTHQGTTGNDKLSGTAAADVMVGGQGDDSLAGGAGNDAVSGGAGNDTLDGGTGNDILKGGTGNDTYIVDSLKDLINEDSAGGNDTIKTSLTFYSLQTHGNVENLSFIGAAAFKGDGNALANSLSGGAGNDTLSGMLGNDTLNGNLGNDSLSGGAGDDLLYGLLGNDRLNGDAGNDQLYGGDGNDTLLGGDGFGFDRLYGGSGNDMLTGGNGEDLFFFDTPLNAATNVDTVSDFELLNDAMYLDQLVFTGVSQGALSAGAFKSGAGVPTTATLDTDDRIYYDTNTGSLYYDKDGSGSAAAVKFAVLASKPVIAADNFIIYSGDV